MAYSAVTQPSPVPFLNGGAPASTLAVQWTRVPPKRTRQDPSAYGLAPRSRTTGRSWSTARPSGRDTKPLHDGGGGLTWKEGNGVHRPAPRLHEIGADNGLAGVVAPLYEHIRGE